MECWPKKINQLLWKEKRKKLKTLQSYVLIGGVTDADGKVLSRNKVFLIQPSLVSHMHGRFNFGFREIAYFFQYFIYLFFMNLLLYCCVLISTWTSLGETRVRTLGEYRESYMVLGKSAFLIFPQLIYPWTNSIFSQFLLSAELTYPGLRAFPFSLHKKLSCNN